MDSCRESRRDDQGKCSEHLGCYVYVSWIEDSSWVRVWSRQQRDIRIVLKQTDGWEYEILCGRPCVLMATSSCTPEEQVSMEEKLEGTHNGL